MDFLIEQIAIKRGYIVTEEGQMINPKGDKIAGCMNKKYFTTYIRVKGKSKQLLTHRLQAYQKYRELLYGEGICVRHKNGNSLDNSWNNILIGTQSENMMDVPKQIRIKRAQHASSSLRKHNKEEIKEFHSKSKSYKKTMKEFNISSKGTLNYILKH